MFQMLNTLEEAQRIIKETPLTFLYISQKNCSVCHGLKPQIEKILSEYPDMRLIELDALDVPEVAGAYQVLTVPVLMLFVEGKEYLRKARIVHTAEFKQEVNRIVTGYHSVLGE